MLRMNASEKFREIPIEAPLKMKYAISNYGRLISYSDSYEDARILKGGRSDGYRTLNYRIKKEDGGFKSKSIFLYKLAAEFFVEKTSEDQTYVLHLDYQRDNDKINNLQWANREEMIAHSKKSPFVIEAKKKRLISDGAKLTATQVIRLKKMLLDPNRKTRMKLLAKQFNISEMQLHRIKKGENWGHIKV